MTASSKIFGGLKSGSSRHFPPKYQCCGCPNRKQSKSIKQSNTFAFVESVHQFVGPKMLGVFFALGSSASIASRPFPLINKVCKLSWPPKNSWQMRWSEAPKSRMDFGVLDVNSGNLGGVSMVKIQVCHVPICLGILQLFNWCGWLKLRLFQYEVISSIHHGFCPLLLLMEKYDSYICLPLSKSVVPIQLSNEKRTLVV